MTLVKICGVVDPENARLAVEMGADFLGLNFYPRSPRFVEVERAREIASAVRDLPVRLVGVFVNRPAREIEEIESEVGLDLIQLSGDEAAAPFVGRTIKAFRGTDGTDGWEDAWAWLFDAPHASLYGGTGTPWNFQSVAGIGGERRVFVAGGIGPGNVRQAIAASRPFAVDVCSRVESAPGIKNPELLLRLFEEVRNAQSQTPP
ncbi:MAG TPA: phosphoribosylanthranilate isomerase [Thermoanaerobaculia bacterium]|nr:phosphoribosylanthranilate isomerase [Thermoanaerobaculia bacterium]